MRNVDWDSAMFAITFLGAIAGVILLLGEVNWLNIGIVVFNSIAAYLNFRAIQRKHSPR